MGDIYGDAGGAGDGVDGGGVSNLNITEGQGGGADEDGDGEDEEDSEDVEDEGERLNSEISFCRC